MDVSLTLSVFVTKQYQKMNDQIDDRTCGLTLVATHDLMLPLFFLSIIQMTGRMLFAF